MMLDINTPVTYLHHRHQMGLRNFLQQFLESAEPENNVNELVDYLKSHTLPLEDFPYQQGVYTRTVLYRHDNGFEVMAARWSKGTRSSIHGHPYFNFYFVMHGCLEVDDYQRHDKGIALASSAIFPVNSVSSFAGNKETFDNNIHQVHAIEETLSIHISSDDSAKGEVFI